MVKKINVLFLLIGCLLFASFSPSLDGRAVVADPGTLPEGYFAKTVGYLPGDSIIVSNLASEKTLDILVVGSLDQSEGVAILLSPEAAAELGIVKDSNVIVKITKRSGQLDEAVSGTAVIAQGETSLSAGMDKNAAGDTEREALADEAAVEAEQADADESDAEAQTEEADESALIAEAADDIEKAETDLENAEGELDTAEDDIAEAEAISDERVSDEPVVTEADDEGERIAEETGAETEGAADKSEAVGETIAATEEEAVPDEKIIAEDVPEDTREISEAIAEDIPAESEQAQESRITDEPVVTESDEALAEAEKAAEESAVDERAVPDEAALSDEKIAVDAPPEEIADVAGDTAQKSDEAPKDEALIAEPVESVPPADDNPYTAIVLTQDDERKTETTDKTSVETRTSEIAQSEVESTTATAESSISVSSSGDALAAATAASIAREYGARSAENLLSLDKGSYYVQIAAFSAPSNIRETLAKYGRDYPVTLVPLASGGATQVMIGPLSVDEYAVVLERFKSYGYKDAFIRKIR